MNSSQKIAPCSNCECNTMVFDYNQITINMVGVVVIMVNIVVVLVRMVLVVVSVAMMQNIYFA